MNNSKRKAGGLSRYSQLLVPLIAILVLVIFNLIRDPGFFSVGLTTNNNGDPVLQGNLISILNGASELVILSMGMTLVTAACGGQDISVGALAAIAGSVFVKVLKSGGGSRHLDRFRPTCQNQCLVHYFSPCQFSVWSQTPCSFFT